MTDRERRARLARRHFLAEPAPSVEAVAEGLVAYHATDPATVYLSAWARMDGFTVTDLDRALYAERTLVKHLAMRRTLFVLPRETLGAAQAAGSDRVAVTERKRLIKDVEDGGLHADGAAWLDAACEATLAALAGRELTMAQLREELQILAGSLVYAPHKPYGGTAPVAPRVLTVLSAEGRVVRASNDGRWLVSRPRWARTEDWLGESVAPASVADMVRRYLYAFGPTTEADVKWWLGSTLGLVRAALAELGAVDVGCGYVLPDDTDPVEAVEPWGALLPGLDPTPMGWKERDFYLGAHKAQVFDTAGNVGPTAWWDGRIVGGWRQDADGVVELQLLEDPGAEARARLTALAGRLTEWLHGVRVMPRFPSPLSKMGAA